LSRIHFGVHARIDQTERTLAIVKRDKVFKNALGGGRLGRIGPTPEHV